MKLLLTSAGLANKSIVDALQELTQKPFNELNLAFNPTASNLEAGDKWWLLEDLATCKKLGFKSIDIIDISALPKKVWKPRLENADVLFFEGGNTFHLMYWIKKIGLGELLPELLTTRVYVGVSAGSIVATPSLVLSSSEKSAVEEIGETASVKGTGLVDFLIEPHINNAYFPELTFDYIEKESKKVEYPIFALDDNSAIKVIDGDIKVVSEGEWKKFG